jgi:hypothetical protein
MLSPPHDQQQLAQFLVRSGTTMFLAGLLWGFGVGVCPYPKLGLHAHSQAMAVGASMVTMGILVTHVEFVGHLSLWEIWTVWITQLLNWPMWFSQVAASFWGTKVMNDMVNPSLKS